MTDRTIFLATDGRYVTVGRGEVEASPALRMSIAAQGLRGWVAAMSGSTYAKRAPKLAQVEAIGGEPGEWNAAVAALLADWPA
jgi:hypothetical protein